MLIKLNSTGNEWVVYDVDLDVYWKHGQQWTANEAFATHFDNQELARRICERDLMLSPEVEIYD